MNANSGAQTHLMHHGRLSIGWKLWAAGAVIVTLVGFALHSAISEWLQGNIEPGLFVFGYFLSAAVAYSFGYFWCLPDVLGGTFPKQTRTLCRRWSDFAGLAAFFAILIINISYIRVIWEEFSYVALWLALPILVAFAWLLAASVVAAEQYLGWTMPRGGAMDETGWRDRVRRAVGRFGNWLVELVGVKKALGIGGGLALLSLILFVRSEIFLGPSYQGYHIVTGVGSWWHTGFWWHQTIPLPVVFLIQACRVVYILGLAVAALAFLSIISGRFGRAIRSSRIVSTLAGAIALFELTELTVFSLSEDPHYLQLSLWMLMWVAPITIWLSFARGGEGRRNHTRLAVMVFYLPTFLLAFAMLPYYTYLALGFGSFIVGMLLVWWGLVQSQWEMALKQSPHSL